jgi:hypothetical protein
MPPESTVSSLVGRETETEHAAPSIASEAVSEPGSAMEFLANFPLYPFF